MCGFCFFWWGVFGFVLCCGGLCVFGGDSSLEGKFEGCFGFGVWVSLYFLDSIFFWFWVFPSWVGFGFGEVWCFCLFWCVWF
jgi:hypothetical protein